MLYLTAEYYIVYLFGLDQRINGECIFTLSFWGSST